MKKIKVDKVILYYMDRVDPDGNPYRFYVYKGMASEIEYFCTEEAGNMTIPIGEGEYVKIVPKEIEKIPVRGYRKLTGIWNRETCNGKGWYRLFNYFKYKPTLCYFKKAGHDVKKDESGISAIYADTEGRTFFNNVLELEVEAGAYFKKGDVLISTLGNPISTNVLMEHYGIVAFLLRAMNVF